MSRVQSVGTIAVVLIVVFLLLFLIVMPALASVLAAQTDSAPQWLIKFLKFNDRFTHGVMLIFVAGWVFFLGSTFASFLNVVAWRVPRGCSILGSSHCPNCDVQLTFRDNIPVIGWWKNKGRCSNCSNPISIRYFLVEVVLGAIFLWIATLVLTTGGATFPIRPPDSPPRWYSLIFKPTAELLQILVFHWTLILVLYTFVLIELEWMKIPFSVWIVGAMFGLVFVAIWPAVMLIDARFPFNGENASRVLNTSVFVASGLTTGSIIGWFIDRCNYVANQPNSLVLGLSIVGLFLGWQSAIVVACLTASFFLVTAKSRFAQPVITNLFCAPHANLLLAVLLHLCTWNWMEKLSLLIGS